MNPTSTRPLVASRSALPLAALSRVQSGELALLSAERLACVQERLARVSNERAW
ncbi:hypothetical protein [Crenobacter cavernae]|uniref:hypothetical protein n=1 Tax=Crenobacter cavernae TaxID=2290923 RepID=UPI001419278E|nr:hypothetical protein [Crenobacter cavernae]